MSNIKLAIESLPKNGGFTYSFNTGELNPTDGFTVAISKENEKVITNIARYKSSSIDKEINDYARKNIGELTGKDKFLGAWIEKGSLYLDVSEVVATEKQAIKLCKKRKQLAYWDNKNKVSIYLN